MVLFHIICLDQLLEILDSFKIFTIKIIVVDYKSLTSYFQGKINRHYMATLLIIQ